MSDSEPPPLSLNPSPNHCYCAHCDTEAKDAKSVTPGMEPQLDDLYLCPCCGEISRLTLQGWTKLTPEEFAALNTDTINDLTFAARSIKAHLTKQ